MQHRVQPQGYVAPIAPKDFIAAVSLQYDLRRAANLRRHSVERNVGGVEKRQAMVIDQFPHQAGDVMSADLYFVVLGTEQPSHTSRLEALVHDGLIVDP